MIAVIKQNAKEEQITHLIDWLKGQGLDIHVSHGQFQTVLGLIGDTAKIDAELIESLDIVESVKRISEPFKQASRKFHPDDSIITVGGGGIPVIKNEDGTLSGTAAVIDKDLASEKLAEDLDADALVILTAVENVSINYKKPDQKDLSLLTVEDAKKYISEGQFAPGSMLPKVEAAMKFALSKPQRKCIITSLEKAVDALNGTAGTTVSL